MLVGFFQQPFDPEGGPSRFGDVLKAKLDSSHFTSGTICSAYASTGGTGPLGGAIRAFTTAGHPLEVIVGLGNGVTSAQAVDHLLTAGATVHGFATGSLFIFHSKIYILEGGGRGWLAVGSCNLTGEGLYRNFETMTISDIDLSDPGDRAVLASARAWLRQLTTFSGNYVALVRASLRSMVSSRLLIDEAAGRSAQQAAITRAAAARARSGVPAIRVQPPPGAAPGFARPRRVAARGGASATTLPAQAPAAAHGQLVWEKRNLPASDAQRIGGGSTNPVGGLRLTQARFQVGGSPIDQTTYFRKLFGAFSWHPPARPRTKAPQEEADIPFDVTLLGNHHGLEMLRVSHKPSGEAGQGNYTTLIHWGPLTLMLKSAIDVTGKTARLYAPPAGAAAPFFLEIA